MSEAALNIFRDWTLPRWLTLSIVLVGLVYLRGWVSIRRTRPQKFTGLRLASFMAGLLVLWLAIASPMDGFADVLLSAHMLEHLLLMSVVPPLLLCGLPVVPLLRGLPQPVLRGVFGPAIRMRTLHRCGTWMVTPAVAWFVMNLSFLGWHLPRAYDFALEHELWHGVEHLCFLFTSLLFWFCVLRPWPARQDRRTWSLLLFLVSADAVNTLLSAFLAFCGRPVYRYYLERVNPFQISPIDDQVLGAVMMWVFGSIAFLLPAMFLTMQLLAGGDHAGSVYRRSLHQADPAEQSSVRADRARGAG
jgi:cytochrome c oxidase assembly factor CtaG